jgi:hypothetical protein
VQVHPYTFRNEARPNIAWTWAADPWAELVSFFHEEGVDGVFTDHPASGVRFLGCLALGHTETLKINTEPYTPPPREPSFGFCFTLSITIAMHSQGSFLAPHVHHMPALVFIVCLSECCRDRIPVMVSQALRLRLLSCRATRSHAPSGGCVSSVACLS